jgi:calcineurin-like phosphoesterase family protein
MLADIPGRKILIRGNHDEGHSASWWMNNGWDFCCDGMIYRGVWLSHKPSDFLPPGCNLAVHGHLHNIWHGFHPEENESPLPHRKLLKNPWQRLFAIEYTQYQPVEFDEFLQKPDKYLARGVNSNNIKIYEYLKFEKPIEKIQVS